MIATATYTGQTTAAHENSIAATLHAGRQVRVDHDEYTRALARNGTVRVIVAARPNGYTVPVPVGTDVAAIDLVLIGDDCGATAPNTDWDAILADLIAHRSPAAMIAAVRISTALARTAWHRARGRAKTMTTVSLTSDDLRAMRAASQHPMTRSLGTKDGYPYTRPS